MKKVVLVVIALVLMVSGVAAVSAYEAHLINVRAHVENALTITWPGLDEEIDFGTVFPEEWLTRDFIVQHSTSFCADNQTRVNSVEYSIFVEWKPCPDMEFAWWDPIEQEWVEGLDYYNWMGYFTYVGIDPVANPLADDLTLVGDPPAGAPGTAAKLVMAAPDPLRKIVPVLNPSDKIVVAIDVPVFEGYWNELTDRLVNPDGKPSGKDLPTYVVPADMPGFDPDGMDFGLDLKVQVTDIYKAEIVD
jgi:hypothetical protein